IGLAVEFTVSRAQFHSPAACLVFFTRPPPPGSPLFPYTTLFRSLRTAAPYLAEAASAMAEQGLAAGTPVTVTGSGSLCAQKSADGTLATMAEVGREMEGDLVVTIGKSAGERHRHQWWESRAMFGWNVLVPRTKAQSAEMSDRIAEHGAVPVEVPT